MFFSDKNDDPVCEQKDNCNISYLDRTQGDTECKKQENDDPVCEQEDNVTFCI